MTPPQSPLGQIPQLHPEPGIRVSRPNRPPRAAATLSRLAPFLIAPLTLINACAPNPASPDPNAIDATAEHRRSATPPLVPAPTRAVANPATLLSGATLAVPLQLTPTSATNSTDAVLIPASELAARLGSSGQPLPTLTVALIETSPETDPTTEPPTWLTPRNAVIALTASELAQRINRSPTTEPVPTPLGWIALVELPSVDAPTADAVLIAGQRIAVDLITDPPTRTPPAWADPADPTPPIPTPAQAQRFIHRLAPDLATPTSWWRLAFLRATAPEPLRTALNDALERAAQRFPSTSARLADAVTDRWRSAIARLRSASPERAEALLIRLTAVTELHTGEFVPAWPPPDPALNDLLRVLTLPSASDERLADRTDIYLRRQPPIAVTVIDDAGRSFAEGQPREDQGPLEPGFDPAQSPFSFARPAPARAVREITIAASEIRGRQTYASITAPGLSGSVGIGLPTLRSKTSTIDVSAPADARTAAFEARVGPARVTRFTPARPIPAAPPGVRLGPLAETHTHTSWWTSRPTLPPADRRTVASLTRQKNRWTLYIEAHRPQTDRAPNPQPTAPQHTNPTPTNPAPLQSAEHEDTIRLYLGAFENRAPTLTITTPSHNRDTPTARLQDETNAPTPPTQAAAGPVTSVTARRGFTIRSAATPTVWRTWITLPPEVTRAPELLLAITRTDGRGAVTAWPRPLLPGQTSPGRRRIELAAWNDIELDFTAHDPIRRPSR